MSFEIKAVVCDISCGPSSSRVSDAQLYGILDTYNIVPSVDQLAVATLVWLLGMTSVTKTVL